MEALLDTRGRPDVKSLLLLTLYLFFWKAAADCPKPQGGENSVLTDEALLLNSFPDGSDVTLECANGYEIESGSGKMRCVDGSWSEPEITCKKKDCGDPEDQPNMIFDTSAGTLFGAVITVTCEEGYQIMGPSYKQCFAKGWTGRPKCEIITCDKPGEVTNGKSSWASQDDPEYRQIIDYVCNDGYTLIGNDHIKCSGTGEYDSQPPECKENVFTAVPTQDGIITNVVTPTATPPTQADCPKPQGGEYSVLTDEALLLNSFPDGSDVTLECANGYEIESGSGKMRCVDGSWSEPEITCKKKDCGDPEDQPNMIFDTRAGTLFGAVITVTCEEGYQIMGPSYKQCFAKGWTGRPKCEIITCDKPGEVTNGKSSWASQDDPEYGETIRYTCNDGYTLIGNDHIKCSGTGEYDSQPPECEESSATETALTDKTITATTVSPSARELDKLDDGTIYVNKDNGYVAVIISVMSVVIVVIIVIIVIYKFFLRRKGSYDTGEDLKPELLQFQNP